MVSTTGNQTTQADEEKNDTYEKDKSAPVPQSSRGAASNLATESKSNAAQDMGLNDEVTALSKKKEEIDPFVTDHLNRAIDFYQGGKYVEAVSEFQLVLQKDPSNETANFYSGVSALALNNPDEALNYFNKTDNKRSRFYEATLWYESLAYLKKDDKKEARKLLEKVVGMNGEYKTKAEETLKEL